MALRCVRGTIVLSRQRRRSHQERVDRPCTKPAFADGPDHQRLAAAHVAGGEHFWQRGLVVAHLGADVAALAEQERRMISARTKTAMAAAKARGVKLGSPTIGEVDIGHFRWSTSQHTSL